ncbi:hypothetical protein PCASD_01198 [Puccinia coronata f. sp. avenae]|uniref:Uncharacterized protein n=1 Tax=Puccinia coronata f. sp. avenae TaxID=200324 RepID=A0A2N5VLK7_9BASI|nr:hypothetical protein PCASD_01198 [Puccinia coronata f. sp. avenae]
MRSVRVHSSFLICSLGAWKIFQGVQPMDYMEIEEDLAHLDPQDRVGPDVRNDQHEGWRARRRSRDEMIITESASSSTPSVNDHWQNRDMTSVSNMTKIRSR